MAGAKIFKGMMDIFDFVYNIETPHELDYISPERSEQNLWVIMCFSTPFIINSPSGIISGKAGDFILNRPYHQYWHTNIKNASHGFTNSWCHVNFQGIEDVFNKYEIHPDCIYHTSDQLSFANDLKELGYEYSNTNFYSEELLLLLFEKMILNLARQHKMFLIKNNLKTNYLDDLIKIRKNMLINYSEPYTIEKLAKQINISGEYFLVLYKKLFDISPMKDLCIKRISIAKMLLLSTDLPINMISRSCGYSDPNYFSRIFKKITGVSPHHFRK